MGMHYNTFIDTHGLVFYYDMFNQAKSWKGQPTTNLYDYGSYQAEGGHTAVRTAGDAPDLYTSVVDYHTITTTTSWVSESARLILWPATTLAASTSFRVSFYARVISKPTTTIGSAFYGNSINNTLSLTNKWQRFSFSSTTHSAYRGLEFGSTDGAIIFQIAGIQWESNAFETPYTKTSRSSTQALKNLVSQNNITVNNLTYNADGSFNFNGSNSYINIGSGTGVNQFSGNFAVSAWAMRQSGGGTWGNLFGDYYTNTIQTTNEWQLMMGNLSGAVHFTFYRVGSGSIINQVSSGKLINEWMHIVVTRIESLYSLYVDGNLITTATDSSTLGTATGNFNIGIDGNNSAEPFSGKIASVMIYKDRGLTASQVMQLYNSQKSRFIGNSALNPAPSATAIRQANPFATDGVYWILPKGQTTAYQCYCQFNYLGNDWMAVSGMSSSGVRADANGNSSGLAGLYLTGENTSYAQLSGNSLGNSLGYNFTLPKDWINACKPKALRVKSQTQDMSALFNKTGSYVTADDIWSYYYAMNSYDNIPSNNGRNHTAATVSSWLSTNVKIYQGTSMVGNGALWSGNHHCGWSDNNHMLHGSTNYTYPGPYPGFCLDGTCWNEAGIVWIAGT